MTSTGPSRPVTGSGSLGADRDVVPGVETGLENYYEAYGVNFDFDKAVRIEGVTFALITVHKGADDFQTVGWLERRGGEWQAHDFALDPTLPQRIEAESEETAFGPITGSGRLGAIWGLVDPTFTRVEVISSAGELLDADVPSQDGGVIVVVDQSAQQLRLFKDEQLVKKVDLEAHSFSPTD